MPDSGSSGATTSETGRRDRSRQPVRSSSNLTTGQFLMWMGQKLHPDAPLYNMVHAFEINGPLDHGHFARAFQALLDRSDALRIVVDEEGGIPRQRFVAPYRHSIDRVDLSGSPDPDCALDDWVSVRSAAPLDLRASAFDTALITLAPDRHVWYLNQHHLITDIWSTALIYRRVSEYYSLSQSGLLEKAPLLPSFEEYVAYEAAYTSSGRAESVADYWQKQRENLADTCQLYGRRGADLSTRTERVRYDLGAERSAKFRAIGQEPGIQALTAHLSYFSIFAALVLAYMRRVGSRQELTLGTPSHNRPTAAFRETIGLFIEVFPFSVTLAEAETFRSLIRKVQREALTFFRNAQPGTSSAAANRGYNVLLNYLPVSFSSEFAGLPMTSTWVHSGHGDSRHHLRIQVHDLDNTGAFQLYFDFNADLFDSRQRLEAVDHFVHLLDAALGDLDQLIISPSLLDAHQQEVLLESGRAPEEMHQDHRSVLEMFDACVKRTPQAVALEFENHEMTYGDLDARSNQLARFLRTHGVDRNVRVGLCLPRCPEAIVAILAVMKSGGTYVPIDPRYPTERLTFIMEDAGVPILLTHSSVASRLNTPSVDVVCLDLGDSEIEAHNPDSTSLGQETLALEYDRHLAAYVIYTSGSTGKPKGVVVGRAALASYVAWARQFYLGGEPHDLPFFTPLAVDLTVTSIFGPLTTGGRVVIYGEDSNPAALMTRVVTDNLVDVIKMTPSHYALVRHLNIPDSRVRMLILGGEDLGSELARDMLRTFGEDVLVYNEYGPTEATVGCMIHRFDASENTGESVPIGRASARMRVYVLDEGQNLAPNGITGELYVSGPQLAFGYLNRRSLTADLFQPDPFHPGERMYRTGDRACRQDDGVIKYLGRLDDQVKLRGARVELGEVGATLCRHPSIRSAEVTVTSFLQRSEANKHCARCGLPSNYPDVSYDSNGVCHLCQAFDRYEQRARDYFRSMHHLEEIFDQSRDAHADAPYDCLVLLSGGKDSTYALARLVDMGLRVLAFTLDNGYISEGAKDNIRRVTVALGVDHIFGQTPAMNAIFVDSLQRFSNVCNGCFKTIYTLALQEARTRRIPLIVTGLSRGQFFETRLTESLFLDDDIDAGKIDSIVLEARKSYHRVEDAVYRLLDVAALQDDTIFEQVQFVDFYRYCDVSLEEMLNYLDQRLPWVRPADTGRSTNCLINNVGIYVHQKERGFHNYAFPYSWDVRVGHKSRKETMEELDDEIDEADVDRILREIGYEVDAVYDEGNENRLAAYYVSDEPLPTSELRAFISARLPEYMVPSYFVHLDALPLNPTGKVDRRALPDPTTERPELHTPYVEPRTDTERHLARLWAEALHLHDIGIRDNFFDLGGDSITAIQIVARANREGILVSPAMLFRGQTIEAVAEALGKPDGNQAERGAVAEKVDPESKPPFGVSESQLSRIATLLNMADRKPKK
ncbi:MAG: amino acid adenylation domain-containing protein [Rhodothermales bacterium]|nr:amino acid adenylation domain-containing protein [Rhodothermales bacterium]